MATKLNWDVLGITTSVACAVHCAILPLLLTSVPVFGINIIDSVSFEYLMIILAFIIGSYALYHGYKKHHHSLIPITLFAFGIVLLLAKQKWHFLQVYFLVPAVISIILAHYSNYRLGRKVRQHFRYNR
jgi:hypothetical protein